MELVTADEASTTIRFDRKELATVMAVLHLAGLEYEALGAGIHGLSRDAVDRVCDDLYDLAGSARAKRDR